MGWFSPLGRVQVAREDVPEGREQDSPRRLVMLWSLRRYLEKGVSGE